jgi:hypothetical protein
MTFIRAIGAAALLSLLGGACAARATAGGESDPLLASVQATTTGDSVQFLLQVTNTRAHPIALALETEPAAYFTVHRGDLLLWNSAQDLARVSPPRPDTIGPAATRTFQASWKPPIGIRGELTVTGVLRDAGHPIARSTRFLVP